MALRRRFASRRGPIKSSMQLIVIRGVSINLLWMAKCFVLGTIGHGPGQFGWIHELACPTENVLYAAELLNWRVQEFALEPMQSCQRAAGYDRMHHESDPTHGAYASTLAQPIISTSDSFLVRRSI